MLDLQTFNQVARVMQAVLKNFSHGERPYPINCCNAASHDVINVGEVTLKLAASWALKDLYRFTWSSQAVVQWSTRKRLP
eukprot:5406794-Amphidinium_carterae.1